MLSAIIVEDDLLSLKSLKRLCSKESSIHVIEEFQNPIHAIEYLHNHTIDLLFLDIEMPEMNGFELLKKLKTIPHTIITTSEEKYAFEAFENEVIDFLKKPIAKDRFDRALLKVLNKIELEKSPPSTNQETDIFLKVDGQLLKIAINDILFIEKVGDYLKVVLHNKVHVIYKTLKSLDQELSHPSLIKIHRSFIINKDHIINYNDNEVQIGAKSIPVSRAHKKLLKESLDFIK